MKKKQQQVPKEKDDHLDFLCVHDTQLKVWRLVHIKQEKGFTRSHDHMNVRIYAIKIKLNVLVKHSLTFLV